MEPKRIVKNAGTQTVLITNDFHWMEIIFIYTKLFLIVHVEHVKLCLTKAVNKQLYESFTNMCNSIPDINCLLETLNENRKLFIN